MAVEPITVYTAYEEDEVAAFLAEARNDLPDVRINVLRESTGDLVRRILDERAEPQHDVIWGLALSSIMDPRILATLEPYRAEGLRTLPDRFHDPDNRWFAVSGYMSVLCINRERLGSLGLPMPVSWADLTNPVYRGEIVMPNPIHSGTGSIAVAAVLQMMGEEVGWRYLEALDENVAEYVPSGSAPCTMASSGQYTIGVSFDLRALKDIEQGYPTVMVIPSEGVGSDLEVNALVASSSHKDAARRFLDWTLSRPATEAYYNWKAIVLVPGGRMPQHFRDAGLPEDLEAVLYPIDMARMAGEKSKMLESWERRFLR